MDCLRVVKGHWLLEVTRGGLGPAEVRGSPLLEEFVDVR